MLLLVPALYLSYPAFNSEGILGTILFEKTMDRNIHGIGNQPGIYRPRARPHGQSPADAHPVGWEVSERRFGFPDSALTEKLFQRFIQSQIGFMMNGNLVRKY